MLATLVVAVVLLVVASPVAAATHPNDRAGMLGPGAVTQSVDTAAPTGLANGRELPDGADRAPVLPTVIVRSDSDAGFDWSSALLGAAGVAGIALGLAGSLAMRSRTPSTAR